MIVKVQLSLASSNGVRNVLVYDEKGEVLLESFAPPTILWLMGKRDRAFFEATINSRGEIALGKMVKEQDW